MLKKKFVRNHFVWHCSNETISEIGLFFLDLDNIYQTLPCLIKWLFKCGPDRQGKINQDRNLGNLNDGVGK